MPKKIRKLNRGAIALVTALIAIPPIGLLAYSVYDGLSVGPNSSGGNGVPTTSDSAAIGNTNNIGDVNGTASGSLAVGSSNLIRDTTGTAYYNTALGSYNSIPGDNSVAMGQVNAVYGFNSMAAGDWNSVDGSKTMALGSHLITESGWDSVVVVGQYNDESEFSGQEAFAVGNGNGVSGSPDYRTNAFVVLKNGDVIIRKPQGDISMGIYGQ